jgi:hypothetical protein
MWAIVIMLHAVSVTALPTKGSINIVTSSYQECQALKDAVVKNWKSDQYRISAGCIPIK